MRLTEDQRNTLYSVAVDSYYLYAHEDEHDEKRKLLIEMESLFDMDSINTSSMDYQNDLRILDGLRYINVKRYTNSSVTVRYGDARITESGWHELVKEYKRRKR